MMMVLTPPLPRPAPAAARPSRGATAAWLLSVDDGVVVQVRGARSVKRDGDGDGDGVGASRPGVNHGVRLDWGGRWRQHFEAIRPAAL
jgi:hypothetical protein